MKTLFLNHRTNSRVKKVLFSVAVVFALITIIQPAYSQNGVLIAPITGTSLSSAMLEVRSTDKGFLAPRMLSSERLAIISPAQGLLVYQTDMPDAGFWYYDGGWIRLSNAIGTVTGVTASSPLASSGGVNPNISLTGIVPIDNGGTGTATTSQNYVFAGPSSSSGNPSFRALVAADIPSGSGNYIQNQTGLAQTGGYWISGSGYLGGSLYVNGFSAFSNTSPAIDLWSYAGYYRIGFDNLGGSVGYIRHNIAAGNATNQWGHAFGHSLAIAGPYTTDMFVGASGNVGIGTTWPVNKFDVKGGAAIGSGYAGTYTAPANGLIVAGNVGIATSAPANLFSVGSTSQFQLNSSGAIVAATGITSSGTINFSGLTASSPVFTDGSKNLTNSGIVPVTNGGTGASSLSGYVYGNGSGAMTASTTIPIIALSSSNITVIPNGIGLSVSGSPVSLGGAVIITSNATSTNTASTIVARDASGNFSAGTITASLNGNATSATSATTAVNFTGSLNGDVIGTEFGNTVAGIRGINVSSTAPASGQVLKYDGAYWAPAADATNAGTVTSVGLSMPGQFTVTNSPVTGTGTLTATWNNQNQNLVFASPNGSSGVPAFRTLVAADIPALPYDNYGSWTLQGSGTNGSNVTSGTTINITGSGATTVSKSGNTVTISSTDNNTTYSAGTGLTLSGTTFNSVWTANGSNIYNNNTTGYVGISNTSPIADLSVGAVAANGSGGHAASDWDWFAFGCNQPKTSTTYWRVGALLQTNESSAPFILGVDVVGNATNGQEVAVLQTGHPNADNSGMLSLQPIAGSGLYSNVLIGTTTPENLYKLYVNGTGGNNGGLAIGSYAGAFTAPPSNGLIVSGFTGIGTSNPLANFTLGAVNQNGTSGQTDWCWYAFGYNQLKTDATYRRVGALLQSNESSAPFILGVNVVGNATQGNEVAILQTAHPGGGTNDGYLGLQTEGGSVLIGTKTTPQSYKLYVNGSMFATGINVNGAYSLPIAQGSSGQFLSYNGTWATPSSLTNPMTTQGDIIYGGTSGAPTRLGIGSANQVLTVISGIPAWVTPSSSGVTGSGTANFSARWTVTGSTLGSGAIYDNGSYVGISNTTLPADLSVGGVNANGTNGHGNTDWDWFAFGCGQSKTNTTYYRVGALLQTNDANPYILGVNVQGGTSGNEISILQTGHIGADNNGMLALQPIGTSSVLIGSLTAETAYKLYVNGSVYATGLNINGAYSLPTTQGTSGQYLSYNGTWATPSSSGGVTGTTPYTANSLTKWSTAGTNGTITNSLITDDGSNVGIGVSTSNYLNVNGMTKVNAGSNSLLFSSTWSNYPAGATNYAEISNDVGSYKGLMIVGNRSGDGTTRKVIIYDRLDINGALNVTGMLYLNGSSGNATQVLTSNGSGTAPTWQNVSGAVSGGANNTLALWTGATTLSNSSNICYSTSNSGMVGIATTSPVSNLTVGAANANNGSGSSWNWYTFGFGQAKTQTIYYRVGTLLQTNETSTNHPFILGVNFVGNGTSGNEIAVLQPGHDVGGDNSGYLGLATEGGYVLIGGRAVLSTSYKLYVTGQCYTTGTWQGSDRRFKKNIIPLQNSLQKVIALQGVNYDWNLKDYPDRGFESGNQIGFIAQDVEKVIPEIVKTDDKGYKALAYDKLTVVLTEAIKEQQKQIDDLKTQNSALLKDNTNIKADNAILKASVERINRKLGLDGKAGNQ